MNAKEAQIMISTQTDKFLIIVIIYLMNFWVLKIINLKITKRLPQCLSSKESACNRADTETWVQSLGQEYPLKKKMTTHLCSCLGNPITEEPGGLKSRRLDKSWARLSGWITNTTTKSVILILDWKDLSIMMILESYLITLKIQYFLGSTIFVSSRLNENVKLLKKYWSLQLISKQSWKFLLTL